MLKHVSIILGLSVSLFACGGDDTPSNQDGGSIADARRGALADGGGNTGADAGALACAPGPIPNPIVLSGSVKDLVGMGTAPGVVIDAYPAGSMTSVAHAVSDPGGNYSLSIPSNNQAWTGNIKVVSDDYINTHIFPSGLNKSLPALNLPALTPNALRLAGVLTMTTISDTDALIIGYVFDCDTVELAGATISTDLESGELFYMTPASPYLDKNATATTEAGAAIIINAKANAATPGKAKVFASYGDKTWEVTVDVIPGEISVAIFFP